ncbi:polysaccharide lyase family 7 protein [Tenacibaculum sp. 190524A05c]|uniref:Polysaccharide lyase family 7 protein n=1 Tax=Tenacibaculum platacis TaxID=3137852 RepID=A0ABM9NU10_9FLAO
MIFRYFIFLVFSLLLSTTVVSQSTNNANSIKKEKKKKRRKKKYRVPKIDLSHWKVTLPIANEKGKPFEIEPPEINNFATIEEAKPYMYIDSTRGAIVFHAMPTQITTKNTKYSRSELREQMEPGSNRVNWKFSDGGNLKAKIAIDDISRKKDGKYHKTIILQIHGRLSNEQRDLIGEDDNNAPPMLKIYWQNGKIRVKTKQLKNISASSTEILHEDAWTDDKGHTFKEKVGFGKFTLEVKVSKGKMVVILNNNEFKVYKNIHMEKWDVFENYFKAGNYFQSRDKGSYAKVRFYKLEVSH